MSDAVQKGLPPSIFFWMRTIFISLSITAAQLKAFANGQKFDPYDLNGGLVSGIAGSNFVIMASDTRLGSYGSYQILSRSHLSSRLWATTSETTTVTGTDGSILFPQDDDEALSLVSLPLALVGSVGCVADCESLKRTIQADVLAHEQWSRPRRTRGVGVRVSATTMALARERVGYPAKLNVNQVANLLGQVLYSRRSFPFYSFCVLGGLNSQGQGQVCVYDGIGSHEQVAVACAGVPGREMMQPVLDRLFTPSHSDKEESTSPPSHVECTAEEAITLLLKAYRSVAEREINVGDDVVLCVLETHLVDSDTHVENTVASQEPTSTTREGRSATMRVLKFPLKKH